MKVIATKPGFYKGERRRLGAEFNFDEKDAKKDKDGKPVLPKWVAPATPEQKAKLADAEKAEADRAQKAIEASAGPKRGGKPAVKASEDLV